LSQPLPRRISGGVARKSPATQEGPIHQKKPTSLTCQIPTCGKPKVRQKTESATVVKKQGGTLLSYGDQLPIKSRSKGKSGREGSGRMRRLQGEKKTHRKKNGGKTWGRPDTPCKGVRGQGTSVRRCQRGHEPRPERKGSSAGSESGNGTKSSKGVE